MSSMPSPEKRKAKGNTGGIMGEMRHHSQFSTYSTQEHFTTSTSLLLLFSLKKKLISLNQRGYVITNGVCRWKKFYVIHQLPVGHIEQISVNETMVPILRKKSFFIRVVSFLVL